MDLKELSYEDLSALSKKIHLEISRRNSFTKSKTNVRRRIYDATKKSLEKAGGANLYWPGRYISDVEKAIFKMCDIALVNYKIKKHSDGKEYIQINSGGFILADSNDYQAMCDELVEVFLKYLNKQDEKKGEKKDE